MYFWQNYFPYPILVSFGPISIRFYGLILVIAIISASYVARKYLLKKSLINKEQFEDLAFWLIIFGLFGARFGHVVFFNFSYYLQNPQDIIKVWHGGLSIQGALLFGLMTAVFWARKNKISFWQLTDAVVPAVALGQSFGRWGNFFNQELYGQPVSWGIAIARVNRVIGYEYFNYFHPAFLYEFILNLCLFFVLRYFLWKKRFKKGTVTLLYFAGYFVIRFFMEFVRIDETPVVFGMRLPQMISLWGFIFVLFFVYYIHIDKRNRV
ncbi:prolipoprotein diacylglyceryl transferase [Patescibacteria group bacterium]|nr:prolipoprotein diacylglyceryl transferase [Patescibacteria group bacterium]